MEPMAQAAINHRTPQPIVETFTFDDERVSRYVWYAGEDLPWPEIKGGWIKRCRVTPIVSFLIWERISDVPEDMRKAVRRDWQDRNHTEAQYEIRPQGIFDSVMAQYGHLGVMELDALRGRSEQDVEALNLDALFCPWDEIPKPYREIEEQIQKALRTVNGDRLLRSVGQQMLASIEKSQKYDEMFVDLEESQKELKYSNPGYRAMSRLGRRRRDHALNDMAAADLAAKKAAAQGSADNSAVVTALVEQNQLMREQNELMREELAQNREMMKTLLADRKPQGARAKDAK